MIFRMYDLVKLAYFHGTLSTKKVKQMLLEKKKPGTYLVRYQVRPGDFDISVVSPRKKNTSPIVSNVVTAAPGGYIFLRTPEKGPNAKLDLSITANREKLIKEEHLQVFKTIDDLIKKKRKELGITKLARKCVCTKSMMDRVELPKEEPNYISSGSSVYGRGSPSPLAASRDHLLNAGGLMVENFVKKPLASLPNFKK